MDSCTRMWVATLFGLGLVVGCGGDNGGGQADGTGGSTTGPASSSTTALPTSTSTTGTTSSCVPGQESCQCLAGDCVGMLHCVDGMCVAGPTFNIDQDERQVIAGPRVPIDMMIMADDFSWSQVSGPTAELQGTDSMQLLVGVPPDAPVGSTIVLRVTATRNTVMDSHDVKLDIVDTTFVDALPDIMDSTQLGTTDAVEFAQGAMWVVSTEGFVSRFDSDGNFLASANLPGTPHGARTGRIPQGQDQPDLDVIYIADSAGQQVVSLTQQGDNVATVTKQADDGSALGTVSFVVPAGGGDVFFCNRTGGQIFFYSLADGTTTLFIDTITNPNVISMGPEADVLYVGGIGKVWRVPILQDNVAGDPAVYLDLGAETDPTFEIGGIQFDEGYNLWVGVPGQESLYMARYTAGKATDVTRSWTQVGTGLSTFANPRFGGNGFDDQTLFWADGTDTRVGSLYVGLGSM